MVPILAEDPNSLIVQVAHVAALSPPGNFVLFVGLGWRDFRFFQRTLKEAEKPR